LPPPGGAALSRRRRRTRARNPCRQLDRKTRADFKSPRRRPAGLPGINFRLNACPKLYRMWFSHACWPPPQPAS
jgi:hypothetical protein